jgi:hypothetical protein
VAGIGPITILSAAHHSWATPWVALIALVVVITPAIPIFGFEILPWMEYEIRAIDADGQGLTRHHRSMFRDQVVSVPWSGVLRVYPAVRASKVWFVECTIPNHPCAHREVIVADSAMQELRARVPDRIRPPHAG